MGTSNILSFYGIRVLSIALLIFPIAILGTIVIPSSTSQNIFQFSKILSFSVMAIGGLTFAGGSREQDGHVHRARLGSVTNKPLQMSEPLQNFKVKNTERDQGIVSYMFYGGAILWVLLILIDFFI